MRRIFEYTFSYSLARKYILFCFRRFYGEIIIKGRENLPTDNSAIVFAPNHLNALMDALAISSIMPPRKAVVYLARADLFANKRIAKLMNFAKILPAFRMRDGFENLENNNKTFHYAIEAMRFGHAVCIMPEGGQGEKRKLRPLTKGIFRIAFDAQKEFSGERNVKIIPFGIDISDLIKSNKTLIINIGKPIEVKEYMEQYESNAPMALNEIKDELANRLSELTRDLATSQYYDAFETITETYAEEYIEDDKTKEHSFEKFKLKQKASKILIDIEKNDPQKMLELSKLSEQYNDFLKKLRFKTSIFNQSKSEETSFVRFLSLLVTFPVFAFGFLTNALPTFLPVWIRKKLKVEYEGFYSSVHFGLGILLFPLFYIVQAILFNCLFSPNWGILLIFILLQFFSRSFSLKWYSNLVKYIHKIRFNSLLVANIKYSSPLYKLIGLRNKILYKINSHQMAE